MEFWATAGGLARNRKRAAAPADIYDTWIRDVKEAETLGFSAFGAPEHHFMFDGFLPVPLVALAAAAAETERIRLITGAMLLPLYDPLRAAEAAATLDVLSGGRLVLGLGMGYRPMEFDGLGQLKKTRGARLAEMMNIIRHATAEEEFSYEGKHYRYSGVRLRPRPVQEPIPMWFCGGTSPAAARRAAAGGFPYWLANCPFEQAESFVMEYWNLGREHGHGPETLRVAVFKDICIGETVAEAEALRARMLELFYDEHILGYGYLVDETGEHLYNPPKSHPAYQRFVESIFCGTAEMVIEELKRYELLGVQAVMLGSPQRELISKKILTEFQ